MRSLLRLSLLLSLSVVDVYEKMVEVQIKIHKEPPDHKMLIKVGELFRSTAVHLVMRVRPKMIKVKSCVRSMHTRALCVVCAVSCVGLHWREKERTKAALCGAVASFTVSSCVDCRVRRRGSVCACEVCAACAVWIHILWCW